ncbi:MAG: hypothetical protein JO036_00320 [Candidatus Eremiobacteraeota bacterium]|nr:hypothetical protein [Candidatus Eremiobacteraeota bacterium]
MLNVGSGALFPAAAVAIGLVAAQCVASALAVHDRITDVAAAIWSVL